jgi:hypothetical protein
MGTTCFDERVALPALRTGQGLRVAMEFENTLRAGTFGVCVAVNRVTRRDGSDVVLFDQVDAAAGFVVMANPDRPVHYKFHQPVSISYRGPEGV